MDQAQLRFRVHRGEAARWRIVWLELLQERGWSKEQAYVLCSVAVDLKVSNVVDVPNVVVSAVLPEDIFQG
jgi:acetamidase/formamidase